MKNKKLLVLFLVIAFAIVAFVLSKTLADTLENDSRVQEDSELTYYLKVSYDGVDKEGTESTDSTTAKIYSGSIYVEDKIPDHLIFKGFVTTDDGSIGAVTDADETKSCLGKVYDDTNEEVEDEEAYSGKWLDESGNELTCEYDSSTGVRTCTNSSSEEVEPYQYIYHGLHYYEATRTVSFKVVNLGAGCHLNVGIVTQTPTLKLLGVDRVDFYNFFTGREQSQNSTSNTVHVYMGKDSVTQYNVSYTYCSTKEDSWPELPATQAYVEGATVGVATPVSMEGYTFTGWTTEDATVTDDSFTMPASDVTFVGCFEERTDKYTVTYQIDGEGPTDYVVPSEKEYIVGTTVTVDSLKEGDELDGYRFKGWTTTDVDITDAGDFEMPENNVTITGTWEKITYELTYAFYTTVLPTQCTSTKTTDCISYTYVEDADDVNYVIYITETHEPGEKVTTPTVENITGYEFLGWYSSSTFTMPEKDYTIYGEWMEVNGYFEPTILKEIDSTKTSFSVGEYIPYKITITNTASFEITDVVVKEDTQNAEFIENENYTINSAHIATIASIPAGESKVVYARMKVTAEDKATIENTAEIIGGLASNGYILKDKEYKSTVETNKDAKITLCKEVTGSDLGKKFQFKIYNDNYETYLVLENNECLSVYVPKADYTIFEIQLQEYELTSVAGSLTSNHAVLSAEYGKEYKITYTNKFNYTGFYHSFGRIENDALGVVSQ